MYYTSNLETDINEDIVQVPLRNIKTKPIGTVDFFLFLPIIPFQDSGDFFNKWRPGHRKGHPTLNQSELLAKTLKDHLASAKAPVWASKRQTAQCHSDF